MAGSEQHDRHGRDGETENDERLGDRHEQDRASGQLRLLGDQPHRGRADARLRVTGGERGKPMASPAPIAISLFP